MDENGIGNMAKALSRAALVLIEQELAARFPNGRFTADDMPKLDAVAQAVASKLMDGLERGAALTGSASASLAAAAMRPDVLRIVKGALAERSLGELAELVREAAFDRSMLIKLAKMESAGKGSKWKQN